MNFLPTKLQNNLLSWELISISLTFYSSINFFLDVTPKKIDHDQDSHYIGVVIALLTSIILLLVAAIMFIVARNKRSPRSDVLNSLQHNFNQDSLGLGIDKRGNHHMKVNFSWHKLWFGLVLWDMHCTC